MVKSCSQCGRIQPCPDHTQSDRGSRGGSTRAWRKVRDRVLKRDGYQCQLRLDVCTGAATHVDHIRARIDGGSDDPSNLRAACAECNLARGCGP